VYGVERRIEVAFLETLSIELGDNCIVASFETLNSSE